ncbi:electron transfer flavoprotein subunit alpha/FixB family protein [Chloroflexota bacterium]
MSEILVFCEKDEIAFELLSKGRKFKKSLDAKLAAAILGQSAEEKVSEYFAYGADKVYLGKDALFTEFYADIYADALYQIVDNYGSELVLVGSTKRGKELAPMVAQKLGAGCVTDAINVDVRDGEVLISRYALGGNTVSSEIIRTPRKVISVMPKAFELGEKESRQGEVIEVNLKLRASRLKIVEKREKEGESANLEEALTLVCVGRGLEKKEDLALIESLAKVLKAEIGCTRPLSHDYQWLSEEREVGLSGKKCKPRLCVSIGISGQIQHAVGIRDCKVLVAINKAKNAPIFNITDYGIVGDLYQVVPKLEEKLQSTSV